MFQADRYHMTMGNFSLSENGRLNKDFLLAEADSRFYASFRKLPFAPCVGHDRLIEYLSHTTVDAPRIRDLKDDRANLSLIGDYLEKNQIGGVVRAVHPGTIMFPREPFADISGHFVTTQLAEIKFEHAFDLPMTVAYRALQMRMAAGTRSLSGFSNRRDDSVDRSVDVAKYSYIGGFDDTSNMEAGHRLNKPTVGTMSHALGQSYVAAAQKMDPKTGLPKHFEQICFEKWLDQHPGGTSLLLDAISIPSGIKHAIAAAKSTPERLQSFKFVRIDTHPLGFWCNYVEKCLRLNGLTETKIMATGDLDETSIHQVIKECPEVSGFGIGTKLISEVENVAGVVFKLCVINGHPSVKCSSEAKSTLPGKLQVWRFTDTDNYYAFDVISTADMHEHLIMAEFEKKHKNLKFGEPLLKEFWINGMHYERSIPLLDEQKSFLQKQLPKFRDLYHYPVYVSDELKALTEKTVKFMNTDFNEYPDIVMPELKK